MITHKTFSHSNYSLTISVLRHLRGSNYPKEPVHHLCNITDHLENTSFSHTNSQLAVIFQTCCTLLDYNDFTRNVHCFEGIFAFYQQPWTVKNVITYKSAKKAPIITILFLQNCIDFRNDFFSLISKDRLFLRELNLKYVKYMRSRFVWALNSSSFPILESQTKCSIKCKRKVNIFNEFPFVKGAFLVTLNIECIAIVDRLFFHLVLGWKRSIYTSSLEVVFLLIVISRKKSTCTFGIVDQRKRFASSLVKWTYTRERIFPHRRVCYSQNMGHSNTNHPGDRIGSTSMSSDFFCNRCYCLHEYL